MCRLQAKMVSCSRLGLGLARAETRPVIVLLCWLSVPVKGRQPFEDASMFTACSWPTWIHRSLDPGWVWSPEQGTLLRRQPGTFQNPPKMSWAVPAALLQHSRFSVSTWSTLIRHPHQPGCLLKNRTRSLHCMLKTPRQLFQLQKCARTLRNGTYAWAFYLATCCFSPSLSFIQAMDSKHAKLPRVPSAPTFTLASAWLFLFCQDAFCM